ncbi:MAG: dTMP kinase [Dehalococcoidia bacterium]|nr:dTMP kinase [Dehalococcoidia bacterium]
MSLFITFEGGEGCGKTTQAKALYGRLSRLAIPAELTHEPGGTALGSQLRRLLKTRRQDEISPEAELFLFAACRIQLVSGVIRPSLQKGKVVICDRFADSTTVYQGYGRGIGSTTIKAVNEFATRGTKPDLTVLLDIPVGKGLGRKQAKMKDRFEAEEIAFHDRVRDGYLKLAADEPERWLVIDATLPKARIGEIIWDRVNQLLNKHHLSLRH